MTHDMTTKDWIQYSTAIAMITSGIVLAFLSFFRNDGDISEGVLWYVAQALTYAGSIFGVSVYFKSKLGAFESRAKTEIAEAIAEAERRGERKSERRQTSRTEANEIDPISNDEL